VKTLGLTKIRESKESRSNKEQKRAYALAINPSKVEDFILLHF